MALTAAEAELRHRVFVAALHALIEQLWLRIDAEYKRIDAGDAEVIAARNMMRAVADRIDDQQFDDDREREDQSRGCGRKLRGPF